MLYEADAANTFDGKRGVTLEARSIDAYSRTGSRALLRRHSPSRLHILVPGLCSLCLTFALLPLACALLYPAFPSLRIFSQPRRIGVGCIIVSCIRLKEFL